MNPSFSSTDLTRRGFTARLLAALAAAPVLACGRVLAADSPPPAPRPSDGGGTGTSPMEWLGAEKIGMLVYPQFTALNLIGPQYMLASMLGAKVNLIAKKRMPVMSDTGVAVLPNQTFADCARDLDVLFVPGGTSGTLEAMADAETIAFLADRGARAKWVASGCTGALLLGAAGLLKGYQATSHWAVRPLLARFGAEPVEARVVRDRNRWTGAGVTAGIDLGLAMVGAIRGRPYAESLQLVSEYEPVPPFDAGTPAKASPANRQMAKSILAPFVQQADAAARVAMSERS